MAKSTVKKAFTLTRDDGSTKDYVVGDTLEKADADHWYAKAHCDEAAEEAATNEAAAAEAQKQAEAATKAGETVRAPTKG